MANFNKWGLGYCSKCGDENGPWAWTKEHGWLCEDCEREMRNKNANSEMQDVHEERGASILSKTVHGTGGAGPSAFDT